MNGGASAIITCAGFQHSHGVQCLFQLMWAQMGAPAAGMVLQVQCKPSPYNERKDIFLVLDMLVA